VKPGNTYDKYGSRNVVARALMRGFLGAVSELYSRVAPESVLEVGCGEGRLATHLLTHAHAPPPKRFVISDHDLGALDPDLDPLLTTCRAPIEALPFDDASFDLVLCCEVLEHLPDPDRGLAEVARVARRAVIVSTPREPLWRGLNLARLAYVRELGNTPGHVQHFSRRGLERLVGRRLRVLASRTPLPWTVLLAAPQPERLAHHEGYARDRE
jgi:ubiquinone/menaquinone biosynthesis C-methylase UbiE